MGKLFWRGFGLGVAIIVIVLVTLFVPILPKLVTWFDPKGLLAFLIVGPVVMGLIVLPAFTFAGLIQSAQSITSPYYWLCVGGLVALIINLLLAIIFIPFTNFVILNSSIFGGVAGGFVYSLFHCQDIIPMMVQDLKAIIDKVCSTLAQPFLKPSPIMVAA